jgi:cyclophilin family peptidyl-prolyl cis-trans isomerase
MRPIAFAAALFMLSTSAAWAQDAPPAAAPTGSVGDGVPAAPATPDPAPPPAPSNPSMTGPQLLVQTSMGAFTLQLDNVRSPQSVAHILRLTRAGHYNGTSIYRVEKNFVIQMGSWLANGEGRGWVPRPVPLEANNGLKNYRLSVALPRDDKIPTSAGPDFYINMRDNLGLDQKPDDTANITGFTVFGQVASGIDVVEAINAVETGSGIKPFPAARPVMPIIITRVSVVGDPPPRPAASTAKPAAAQPRPAQAKPAPARRAN